FQSFGQPKGESNIGPRASDIAQRKLRAGPQMKNIGDVLEQAHMQSMRRKAFLIMDWKLAIRSAACFFQLIQVRSKCFQRLENRVRRSACRATATEGRIRQIKTL